MSTNGTAAGKTGAAPGAAAPPGGSAPAGARLDVGVLVYHTVIVLLALVALVVSLRLPRAFARLWHVSEWTRGHFLGYAAYAGPSQFPYTGSAASTTIDLSHGVGSSQDSHTYEAKFDVSSRTETPGSYPPRVESTPSFLRPVVSVLRSRVAPGFSAAQMAICAGWLGVLLYPTIYRSAGPFTDINRYGFIAISQVPFIFALGTKNNVLGIFLGMGYEKLNFLHRFVARLAIISAHLHGLGYIYKWCLANNFMQEIAQPKNYFGLLLLLSFDCILLTSLAFVRKNAYNLFLYSHIVFFHTVLICGFNHYLQLTPYLFATGAIYGLDKLMRMAKTRVKTATIRPIPQLGVTRIEIPDLNKGWRAGQHVRIQVFSSAMGIFGWAQVHPFTIASESNSKEGLVLMCKKTGTWTHKLFAAASKSQAEWDAGRNIRVVVEGPYGGPGFTMFNSFSAAMFIVGGSGITFALSAIQELIQQDSRGESRVRVIKLIWIVQDASSSIPLIPQFSAMIHQSTNTRLNISVHYTKAVVGKIRFTGLQPGITLNPGRPGLIAAIEGTVSYTASIGGGNAGVHSGLIVGVCGPVALADDVSKAVGLVDPAKRDEIGGIEIHEEAFGW
ncbi:Ferric reductase transmembrane component 5 [Mycena venus]|uniref:ferric-chelate reductase (NADPH) n=1 Tax=Mycena venus TaxID=2733690 RepID=A0A8H7CE08_9AGAR|nr:Ferric reductase transmembrane component 5 [Mycena venus]